MHQSVTLLSFRTLRSGKGKSNFMTNLKKRLRNQGWKNTGENEYALYGDTPDANLMIDRVTWFLAEMWRNHIELSSVSVQFHRTRM